MATTAALRATHEGAGLSPAGHANLKIIGRIYAITIYNGRLEASSRRLPTSKMPVTERRSGREAEMHEPCFRHAGYAQGGFIANLLHHTRHRIQLIKSENGLKFEVWFNGEDQDDANHWLSPHHCDRVLESLSKQNVGFVSAFDNPQGIMLVLTPVGDNRVGGQTPLRLDLREDDLLLMAPADFEINR